MTSTWMLYGASGYTGTLLAEEAVRRGHHPLLAGRSAARLAPLAERLGLEFATFPLDDPAALRAHLDRVELVFHAAGPFIRTSAPMLAACLDTRTHYLDITGEYAVYEAIFAQDAAAREAGIALVPGAGFDVIPSDCLAASVAAQVPDAVRLETAIYALTRISGGTLRSLLDMAPGGVRVRRDGRLVTLPFGTGARTIRFPVGTFWAAPIPWGDISTSYRTTGIPNITAYKTLSRAAIALGRLAAPAALTLLESGRLRRILGGAGSRLAHGPDEAARKTMRSYLWARAENTDGQAVEGWLETAEAYRFTALAGVRAVEHLLAHPRAGALSPVQALGTDFVLEIEGTRRYDSLA